MNKKEYHLSLKQEADRIIESFFLTDKPDLSGVNESTVIAYLEILTDQYLEDLEATNSPRLSLEECVKLSEEHTLRHQEQSLNGQIMQWIAARKRFDEKFKSINKLKTRIINDYVDAYDEVVRREEETEYKERIQDSIKDFGLTFKGSLCEKFEDELGVVEWDVQGVAKKRKYYLNRRMFKIMESILRKKRSNILHKKQNSNSRKRAFTWELDDEIASELSKSEYIKSHIDGKEEEFINIITMKSNKQIYWYEKDSPNSPKVLSLLVRALSIKLFDLKEDQALRKGTFTWVQRHFLNGYTRKEFELSALQGIKTEYPYGTLWDLIKQEVYAIFERFLTNKF